MLNKKLKTIAGKMEKKYWKSQGNLLIRKSGNQEGGASGLSFWKPNFKTCCEMLHERPSPGMVILWFLFLTSETCEVFFLISCTAMMNEFVLF